MAMRINPIIYSTMLEQNNMITTAQVLELGFSKMLLSKYVRQGLLTRLRHGIYTMADEVHDHLYTMMLRSDNIVFSHETALFLLGLVDREPDAPCVTIPVDASLPNSLKFDCNCFYIKNELHQMGLASHKTEFGNDVRCYNAERTICDIVRSRSRIDDEVYQTAIRNYAKLPQKNIALLAEYAVKFHILKHIREIFEIIT